MPDDGHGINRADTPARRGPTSWFALPAPLKQLFDRFPLHTYASNDFPQSAQRYDNENVLFIFTSSEGAVNGAPSFNPGCLKWQTCLKIAGISFRTVASNNHASPTGSLPFIVTTVGNHTETVAGNSLRRWLQAQQGAKAELRSLDHAREETYKALIEHNLRLAWLFQLYLEPSNEVVASDLYLSAASSNALVQLAIGRQLREAAGSELRKTSFLRRRDEVEIWREAEDAFQALSIQLGHRMWFFGEEAGLFDASVFAYTHLILDEQTIPWRDNKLATMLQKHENLVQHRDRMLDMFY